MAESSDLSHSGTIANAVPSVSEALRTWARIGALSFGGPTAQIALMHRILVDEKRWLTEKQYLNALSFCMLLPGPEAMQLATYAGWRLHGTFGGLAAGLLFVLPGACVVLALSMIYASFGNVPALQAVFLGIKAAVLVIVIEALLRVGRRALKAPRNWLIAGAAFVAIFFGGLPFPLIIAAAAIIGYFSVDPSGTEDVHTSTLTASVAKTGKTIVIWLAVWLAPLFCVAFAFGSSHILSDMIWFFSKLALVTFGGAYSVLAYMAQDVVTHHNWLDARQMMDGLGLAETTPGPLILVTQFVGYLAAYENGGSSIPLGLAGAAVALWATFAPCFLWIFAGAPYIEWIISKPKLRGALACIMAAVVGVILNLAIWFALHVFFATVTLHKAYGLKFWVPEVSTLDWRIVVLAAISAYLLLFRHWGIAGVLATVSMIGIVAHVSGV